MTLRFKALLIIHLTAAALVLLVFLMARHMLLGAFQDLEYQQALRSVETVLSDIRQRQRALRTVARDWASWDDAYHFAKNPGPEFIKSNVVPATLTDLDIDLLVLADASGRLLIDKALDRATRQVKPLGPGMRQQLAERSFLLAHGEVDDEHSGIIMLDGRPALVVSLPVLTSDKKGPVAGGLLMGRFINQSWIDNLASESMTILGLRPASGPGAAPADIKLATALLKEPTVRVVLKNDDLLQASTVIKGLTGRPALLLEVSLPRTTWKKAKSLVIHIFVALLGAGAVVVLVSLVLTERVLLGRLTKLTSRITEIGKSGDLQARMDLAANDELGLLSGEIDNMLQALEQARNKQSEAEYLYRAITEEAASGIFIVENNHFVFMNPAGLKMLGHHWESVQHLKARDLIEPEYLDEVVAYIQDREAGRTTRPSVEFQTRRPDGTPRWLQLTVSPIVHRGRPCTLGTVFDITDRKLAEEKLRQSEQLLRASFEAMPESLTITEIASGRILEVNHGFTHLTGYSYQQAVSRTLQELNLYVDYSDRQRFIDALARDGEVRGMEINYRLKDGSVMTTSVDSRPLMYKGRRCVVSIARDITPLKEAAAREKKLQSELQQAQKMEAVGTLAGGVAHDFNNILQAISGYVELMRVHTPAEDAAQHQRLSEISLAARRAGVLVRDLLMFSRRMEPKRQPLDLNHSVRHAVNLLKRTIPRMIIIDAKLAEDLHAIEGDAGQLEQVVLNLGANARDAMADGGVLTIETENLTITPEMSQDRAGLAPGPYVRLRVSDTGEGIAPADLEHIFEPFYTTKDVSKGTGLGLSTVFGIVKAHGGHIAGKNLQPTGACFEVLLPASPDLKPPPPAQGDADMTLGQKSRGVETILVVDDEESIAQGTREALEQFGYTVRLANSGEEALDVFDQAGGEIDLVVLDLNMPGMGGQKCLELLVGLDPDLPVIIASGYADGSLAERVLDLGAAGFINKPYRFSQLVEVIRKVFDEQALPQDPAAS